MRAFVRRFVLATALLVPAIALGDPPGLTPSTDPPPRGPGANAGPIKPGQGPEAIKKRIRALRASTLIDELQLDEATAAKVFPIFGKYDDESEKLLKQRQEIQHRLATVADGKDNHAIDAAIDDAVANQRAFWDLEVHRLGELRKVLTPAQTARLVVVLPALERQIQNQLRKALQQAKRKQQNGAGGKPRRPAGQRPAGGDDDDDDDE